MSTFFVARPHVPFVTCACGRILYTRDGRAECEACAVDLSVEVTVQPRMEDFSAKKQPTVEEPA